MTSEAEDDEVTLESDAFERNVKTPKVGWDDDVPDPEASTYPLAEPGPEPIPAWVITEAAARQHELGVLKTGKEAEVVVIERTLGERSTRLAAKRYRDLTRRSFRNDARYREPRATGDTRADRAMTKGTRKGQAFRAQMWAEAEFTTLCRLWEAGVAVPYPVQLLGTEVVLELLGDDEQAAPRLADVKARHCDMPDLAQQAVTALRLMTAAGIVHADLSPYNTLVWESKLYVIDVPQAMDITSSDGAALLRRDVDNLLGWMAGKGGKVDPDAVYAELMAAVLRGPR